MALSGTGMAVLAVELDELLPDALRAVDVLAVDEAADVDAAPDKTPLLLDEVLTADVELVLERLPELLLARFNTDDEFEVNDEPLVLEAGVRRELDAAEELAPAPDEEPPVLDADAATVPLWLAWMYKSCKLPGSR